MVGKQTFYDASAFNANIGAWNTAAVTTMYEVYAVSAAVRNAAGSCARSGYECNYTLFAMEM